MTEIQSKLDAFIRRWLSQRDIEFSAEHLGTILIRELLATLLQSGDEATWRRRPSISFDGTPVILSRKIGRSEGDALRLLIEPGTLGMTVAQQIAFSLTRLDRILGLLGWRSAVADVNTITTQIFPSDPAATSGWWGGIWLGTSVPTPADGAASADLRLYLNLRHGTAAERWRTLRSLVSLFVSPSLEPMLDNWVATVSPHAIPVGLGVVMAAGQVCAIRAYVGLYNPTIGSLSALSSIFSAATLGELAKVHDSFTERFGSMRPQAVSIGYDFLRAIAEGSPMAINRVKVDICCQLVAPERRVTVASWIKQLLLGWSFESSPLEAFLDDVHAVWAGSEIQFLSLGFAPSLRHVTVYAKPCT